MFSITFDLNAPLSRTLTESVDMVRVRETSAITDLLRFWDNRCVIFGCGALGRRAIAKLLEMGIQPLALCDNNRSLWGTQIQGIPVLSVKDAANRFGGRAAFLIAVWNPHHWYGETSEQLRLAGARHVFSFHPIFWKFPYDSLPVRLLNDLPSKVYEAKEQVLAAETVWVDDLSLRIYRANIQWRAMGNPDLMPARPSENTYFPDDIFSPAPEECFVDCGAYDGDTVTQFLRKYGENFSAVYPIEGDPVSYEKLSRRMAALPAHIANKIHPVHGAVGPVNAMVRFGSEGGTGSRIVEEESAGADVPCYALDDLAFAHVVTMIKMDIEGAEYGALLGGRRLIQRDKPILAICVYHTQNDIWRIPLLVRDFLPRHKLYLRAYEGDGFQTVLYAVPPERARI